MALQLPLLASQVRQVSCWLHRSHSYTEMCSGEFERGFSYFINGLRRRTKANKCWLLTLKLIIPSQGGRP
jgi:hypothetical protein